MANKQVLPEGSSINRPPGFNGEAYDYWKIRMKIFIEAQDMDLWNAIENGPYVPYDEIEGKVVIKRKEQWTSNDKLLVQQDLKAKNILTSALGFDEFYRISNCKTAKEMWDTLQVTHEGTQEVKRSRLNTLSQEYELFRMKSGETVAEMQKRFTHIINHLQALGKTYTADELNLKVLRSLSRQWQPKVTAISEKKSLSSMTLAALFGKLQEHEMELSRLDEIEDSEKGRHRSIALKTTEKRKEDSSSESTSDDEVTLLTRKFNKFLKRNHRKKNFRFTQKKGENSSKVTCFECGKTGHIKADCPDLKKVPAKKFKKKPRKAYIAWEDNDSTASSSSSECEEQANLCLMTKDDTEVLVLSESDSSSNSYASSSSHLNYDTLYNAFQELLNDSVIIERENTKLKSQLKQLILKNTELMTDLDRANTQLEFMDNLEKSETPCETCPKLKKEIETLTKTAQMYARTLDNNYQNSSFVLDSMLRAQRKASNKQGLGYGSNTKKSANARSKHTSNTVFVKARNIPTCTYCLRPGHINTRCNIKLIGIPKGKYKWVVKRNSHNTNQNGPSVTWFPT